MNLHRTLVETLLILTATNFSARARICMSRLSISNACLTHACACPKSEEMMDLDYPSLPQSGAFCYTPFGRYGPGPMLPLGVPCSIQSPQGLVRVRSVCRSVAEMPVVQERASHRSMRVDSIVPQWWSSNSHGAPASSLPRLDKQSEKDRGPWPVSILS
jgi:hypothetical protein